MNRLLIKERGIAFFTIILIINLRYFVLHVEHVLTFRHFCKVKRTYLTDIRTMAHPTNWSAHISGVSIRNTSIAYLIHHRKTINCFSFCGIIYKEKLQLYSFINRKRVSTNFILSQARCVCHYSAGSDVAFSCASSGFSSFHFVVFCDSKFRSSSPS